MQGVWTPANRGSFRDLTVDNVVDTAWNPSTLRGPVFAANCRREYCIVFRSDTQIAQLVVCGASVC